MKRLVICVLVWIGIYALIYFSWVLWEIRRQGYITPRFSDTIIAIAVTSILTEWIIAWAFPSDPTH